MNCYQVEIIEKPAQSAVRFRYESEHSAAEIPGVNSTSCQTTYPTVRIQNYSGNRTMIVVSCVTRDEPFRQHPNHLVGHHSCHNGVYIEILDKNQNVFELKRCGIQCAKRSQVRDRLVLRREMGCDPTNGGFDHLEPKGRDLSVTAVRLCFQIYVEDELTGLLTVPLPPVVSDPIYDKKLCSSLEISDISQTCCPMSGAKVMLFCNRCEDNDIEVVFYQTDSSDRIVWTAKADTRYPYGRCDKSRISILAPNYWDTNSYQYNEVFIQLRRPSDQSRSEPIVFTYLPECPYLLCPINEFLNFTHNV